MKDLTQGPVLRLLLGLSGAYLLNIATGMLRMMAEVFWAGRLDSSSLAAITLAANPLMIVLALAPVVAIGSRVLIAQAVGAGNRTRCGQLFNESLAASIIVMGLLGLLAWVFRQTFAEATTNDAATAAQIGAYLGWAIPAVVIQVPAAVMSSALAATGNLRITVRVQTLGVIVNLLTAPLLMFGWLGLPALGIAGAGVAALMSSSLTLVLLLARAPEADDWLPLRPGQWLRRPQLLGEVVLIGLPVGIESALTGLYFTAVAFVLRPFGPIEQAAFGVGQRLIQLGTLPLMALSAGASIIVGQNFGASNLDRVRQTFRSAAGLGLCLMPLLWILCLLIPEPVARAFSDDPAVIQACARYLAIASFVLIPSAVVFAALAVLSGVGNTAAGLITAVVHALFVVLLALALQRYAALTPDRLWLLVAAASIVEMTMALLFLRRETGRSVASGKGLSEAGLSTAQ